MELNQIGEAGAGRLYEANSFLVPVLEGDPEEMGTQYGALMGEHMQATYDVLVKPGADAGAITAATAEAATERARATCSLRNRRFYDGVAAGAGWPMDKVVLLDQFMEYGIYQSKIHAFAGCTSAAAWGARSSDGQTYVGRNMDWSPMFNEFPQVVTVQKPSDGSYRWANVGWPGMYFAMTALNEHGLYLDVHDGTSMGGSVVFVDRASTLGLLADILAEADSAWGAVRRMNATANSTSVILTLADDAGAVSIECSSLGGNRLQQPDGESLVVVNTFLNPDWGLQKRDTVSNSLHRFDNMTARLSEQAGKVDAEAMRAMMDLPLFAEDGSFLEGGGCTKPTKIDADSTVYQTVVDISRRQLWVKVPAPSTFADWTHFDLAQLWD